MARLYLDIGSADRDRTRYESDAARATGERVRGELLASLKSTREGHSAHTRPERGGLTP
jgi:hypothetical protein